VIDFLVDTLIYVKIGGGPNELFISGSRGERTTM